MQILDVLLLLSEQVEIFPQTKAALRPIMDAYERMTGFPDAVGAVDGSIFRLEQPFEYEGFAILALQLDFAPHPFSSWICRKGFAAINMQATVDHKCKFMKYSLRPGSCSDKNVWTMSNLGQNSRSLVPPDCHLLGDAGYTLTEQLLTPYAIYDGMPTDEKRYNRQHSRTRIVVERAFGLLKGRWRVLKRTLNMKTPQSAARTIVAAMVLHNLTIDCGDTVSFPPADIGDPFLSQHVHVNYRNRAAEREAAIIKRDYIKEYLMTLNL